LWKIPKKAETEYGIIADPKEAKGLFEKFLNENNLRLDRLKSGVVPQGFLIPKNLLITLCGDASGVTKPWSGGGIVWSLIAAEILLKNFPDFLKYQKAMQSFFRLKIILSKIIIKMAYFLGFNLGAILPENIKIEGDFLI
jgi:flavin-dependent dehydrogenase